MSFGLGKLGRLGRLGVASGRGTGGGGMRVQKDMYFSGKNAYIYACSKNGVKELHLYGHSEQDGIPAPDTPAEISSVGDSYLQLYVLDINHPDKGGQIIDFGDIVLRSLPSGVCDEIVYRDKQWRYIQRVYHTYISNAYYHNTTAKFAMVNLNPTYGGLHNNQNYVMSNRFIIGSFEDMSNNIGISYINAVNSTYAFNFENEPGTNDHVQEWLANNPTELIYQLAEPIETVLDLPQIEFSSETIYLLTNEQTIKPYLQGYYDVDLKVSGKKLEYIREGLMSRWQPINLNNADKPDKVADRVRGSDLMTTGFGYIAESGFNPTYVQLDGIDDGLINTREYEPESIKHVQITLSNISNADGKADAYCVSINNYGGGKRQGISNEGTISTGVGGTSFFLDTEQVDGYPGIYDDTDAVLNIALQNTDDSADLKIITVGVAYRDYAATAAKERFYEAVAYNRALSGEEIENNYLVSQVRNGVNIPDGVDPIDIIAERTYASGKKFPVYNTYRDRDNDNIESFQILGYTVQDGTPTPESPIPLLSVGDEGLKLCISGSETGVALQVVDFGDIVLRSIPKGICDSIEWDGKNWRHVQRVGYVKITPDDIVSVSKIDTSHTNYYVQILGVNKGIISNDFKYFRANTKYVNHYMCNKFTYAPTADILNTWYLVENSSILSGWVITDKPTKEEFLELIGDGFEFIGELAEPVETILEGIPAPQTSDNETWFGTPPASVKPYMMCECKVKRALKYQGDISAWWYFGGNKSNETDRQITDISGNGNDLTPYNFAWTRESGWNQGGICSDGIDDYLIHNEELSIENILIITSEFENNSGGVKYVLGFRSDNNNGGLCLTAKNRMGSANSYLTSSPNNVLPEPLNYLLLTNNVSNYSSGISLLTFFATDYYCSNGTLHEVILFEDYLTDSEYDNNLKVAKQRNGVDGDINILLADSDGDLLADSENYYLTSN